jgi:hypothetical protein
MYVEIEWNGKAAVSDFVVNCYGPQKVEFISDDSDKVGSREAMGYCDAKDNLVRRYR